MINVILYLIIGGAIGEGVKHYFVEPPKTEEQITQEFYDEELKELEKENDEIKTSKD